MRDLVSRLSTDAEKKEQRAPAFLRNDHSCVLFPYTQKPHFCYCILSLSLQNGHNGHKKISISKVHLLNIPPLEK